MMRVGPEELEVNCNGLSHVEAEQWRNNKVEDQHNGNTEPTAKCGTREEKPKEPPPYSICNGVDAAELKELDTETDDRGARSSGVAVRHLPVGLEEGELEQSICQEEGEDRPDCQYRTQEDLRNGQSPKLITSAN